MLDFAWSELLVVIVVAVLVIGPKDIPKLMHGLGRVMRRAHYLKFALSQQFEDLMREHDLDELRQMTQKDAARQPETDEAAADAEAESEAEPEEQPKEQEVTDERHDSANPTRH